MPWYGLEGSHARKFLVTTGDYLTGATGRVATGRVGFWGEWEAPSTFEAFDPDASVATPGFPRYWHTPSLPRLAPTEARRNTDPLVLGPDFIYSNCKQSPAMQALAKGSLVLFGSGHDVDGRRGFVLDTCLVVGSREPGLLTEEDPDRYGEDTFDDAVLGALASEKRHNPNKQPDPHTVYRGTRWSPAADQPFSFVPCLTADPSPEPFRRPALDLAQDLADWVNPRMQQGIKGSARVATPEDVRQVWTAVRDAVLAEGLALGVRFDDPERR